MISAINGGVINCLIIEHTFSCLLWRFIIKDGELAVSQYNYETLNIQEALEHSYTDDAILKEL
jgi:hypothetical protein